MMIKTPQLWKFGKAIKNKVVSPEALTTLPILIISLIPSVAQASCLIWTSWQPTRLTAQQCLNRAEVALRNSGFTGNFTTLESGAYGENSEEYSGTLRCITSKGVAFFIVAGPKAKEADRLLTELENNF